MKTKLLILRVLALVAVLFICLSCEKDNFLVGTTWECKPENTKVSFTSNSSGFFYWSEDGVDYEKYKHSYSLDGNDIVVNVTFPRRIYKMTGVIDGNVIHFGGKALTLDYVKL